MKSPWHSEPAFPGSSSAGRQPSTGRVCGRHGADTCRLLSPFCLPMNLRCRMSEAQSSVGQSSLARPGLLSVRQSFLRNEESLVPEQGPHGSLTKAGSAAGPAAQLSASSPTLKSLRFAAVDASELASPKVTRPGGAGARARRFSWLLGGHLPPRSRGSTARISLDRPPRLLVTRPTHQFPVAAATDTQRGRKLG